MKSDKEIINAIKMKQQKKKYLDYEDFKEFVKSLSCSQGFYSRLYASLLELEEEGNEDSLEDLKQAIKDKKFTDTLDFVYWLEC